MIALLALVLAWIFGWLVVRLLWPASLLVGTRCWRGSLALGAGVGMLSVVWFGLLVVFGRATAGIAVTVEFALLVGLAIATARAARRSDPAAAAAAAEVAAGSHQVVWGNVALALVALAAVASFACATAMDPQGIIDALTIWNLRAQLLFDSGTAWQRAIAAEPSLHHVDYPLLLPLAITRGWQFAGDATPWMPAGLAAGFTFATAGVCWGVLRRLRGATAAAAAAAVLLASPAFLATGAMQYADVPLAFFLTATMSLLVLHATLPGTDRRLVVLAGAMLGFAAWTKNEGLLFAGVVPCSMVAVAGRGTRWRVLTDLPALFAGALPALVALFVFKIALVPTNDLVAQVAAGNAWQRLFDGSRWVAIARGFAACAWSIGPCVVVAMVLWGLTHRGQRWRLPACVASVMLLGYAATYLCASSNLEWHLGTSAQRLLLHLLPMTVLAIFSARAVAAAAPAGLTPPPSRRSDRS